MVKIWKISENGIYTDLMRRFQESNHDVYILTLCERREDIKTHLVESSVIHVLNLRTLNVQKANVIEKV